MWESLWLGLLGLAGGALLTVGPYAYLARTGLDMTAAMGGQGPEVAGVGMSMVLKVGIYPENAALIAAAVLVATLGAGLYPAWRAVRVVPVDSIRLV